MRGGDLLEVSLEVNKQIQGLPESETLQKVYDSNKKTVGTR